MKFPITDENVLHLFIPYAKKESVFTAFFLYQP